MIVVPRSRAKYMPRNVPIMDNIGLKKQNFFSEKHFFLPQAGIESQAGIELCVSPLAGIELVISTLSNFIFNCQKTDLKFETRLTRAPVLAAHAPLA